jgi:chromosome segregation ATPase
MQVEVERAKSAEVINNLKQEIDLVQQSNNKVEHEDSEVVRKLREQLLESNTRVEALSEELQNCQQDQFLKENRLIENRTGFEEQLAVKDAALNNLNDKMNLVEEELTSSKGIADHFKREVEDLKLSIEEESLKNRNKMKDLEVIHSNELLTLEQKLCSHESQIIEAHKSEMAVLKVTEQELLAELNVVKNNCKNLQSELGLAQSEISSALAENNHKETEIKNFTEKFAVLEAKLDESITSCKNLNIELDDNIKIKEDLQARLDSSNTESENLQILRMKLEASEKMEKNVKHLLTDMEKSKSEVSSNLETMTSNNQDLQTKLGTALSSTVELEARLDTALTMKAELQVELDTNTTHHQGEIQAMQTKLSLAEESSNNLQLKFDDEEQSRKDLQVQQDSVTKSHQDQILDLQSQIDRAELQIKELEDKCKNMQNIELELEQKLSEEKHRSEKFQLMINTESRSLDDYHELENNNKELQRKLDLALTSSREQMDAMQSKLNSSESQIEMLNETEEKLIDVESRNSLLIEEQNIFKEKYSEALKELNYSKQYVEDLHTQVKKLEQDIIKSQNSKDEVENKFTSLALKAEELEADNKNINQSNRSLKEEVLQGNANCKVLTEKCEESQKEVENLKTKENDFNEAITSLKSINEMISKSARDSEARKKDLEIKLKEIDSVKSNLESSIKNFENKNIELKSQLYLVSSQKKEVEVHFVESENKITALRDEIKQLSLAKEARVEEEKDVDESEQTAIDKNMVQVLNEKIRENTQMKSENNYLLQNLTAEREAKEKLESELAECKQTYSSMNTETVKKLSMLVRDKDLEIESLSERNKSLLEVIENEKGTEKDNDTKEAKLLEEIRKLKDEHIKDKASVENSNELLYLKGRIAELERKSTINVGTEKIVEKVQTSSLDNQIIQQEEAEAGDHGDRSLALRLETKSLQLESVEKEASLLSQELAEVRSSLKRQEDELVKVKEELGRSQGRGGELQQEVDRVRHSLVSLQGMLEEKTTSNMSQQEQVRLSDDMAMLQCYNVTMLQCCRASSTYLSVKDCLKS